MLAVVHSVLCWGESFTRKHVVFHVDNEAVFSALNKLTIDSAPTMILLKKLIYLLCCPDFSFSSVWLSSSDNAIADAASCFSFSRMFELAPHLNPKPSSKCLRIGGTTSIHSGQKPLHFTFGTALLPVLGEHTQHTWNGDKEEGLERTSRSSVLAEPGKGILDSGSPFKPFLDSMI